MREKLTEILRKYTESCRTKRFTWVQLADHLIANGVTVQRWIPVTERLPHKEWEERKTGHEFYDCLISRTMNVLENRQWIKKQVSEKGWFDGEGFVDLVGIDISSSVTHWMPLPDAPKDGDT